MAWLIITVIAILVVAGCLVAFIGSAGGDSKVAAVGTAAVASIVWVVISVALSVHTVGQRQVGIVHNFSGTITGRVDPGVAWTAPWQGITKENVGLQKEEFFLNSGNSAVSQDIQPIYADVQLNFEVEPRNVVSLYKQVGPQWKSILLEGRMLQVFKNVTASFTADQITTKRPELRARATEQMQNELRKYDIKVVDVLIKDLGYGEQYLAAITAKNVQKQSALQAEAKVAQSRAEASQEVAKAEGDARAKVIRAKADALALAQKGEAIRKNPEVLQLEAIDKLNPLAQVVICTGSGAGNCPAFIPTNGFAGGAGQ